MMVRTLLFAALVGAGCLAGPMAAAAEPPQSAVDAAAGGEAADMAVLDRFYLAVGSKDEAALAELLDGAMIWIGGKGARFVRPSSPATPGAVLESVFGPGVGPFDDFGASATLYLPSGSHVVTLGQYTGYGPVDAVPHIDFAHVFTFEGGRLIHFQPFTGTAAP